jgi:nickel-dependent lactate racemase
MPSKITIPAIISSLSIPAGDGSPTGLPVNSTDTPSRPSDDCITILIATGLHRPMTRDEMVEQLGMDICSRYRVINHDARDLASLASFGKLSTGNELLLNALVNESDLVIAEGFIEPHFFAGFSGGRKSILPGIAGESTILANHKPEYIANPNSRQSSLDGNPIHSECSEAAALSGLRFILNVALDKNKQIVAAFAGDPIKAHLEGCRFVNEAMSVDAEPTDIVITTNNGYPLDRNLYQVVKGIDTAATVVKDGGVIIVAARCIDHVGHDHFKNLVLSCASVGELCEKMSVSPSEIDKWQAQVLARILSNHKVILVSEGIERELAERMFFTYAGSLAEAMELALAAAGRGASIAVLPEGPVIIPRVTA